MGSASSEQNRPAVSFTRGTMCSIAHKTPNITSEINMFTAREKWFDYLIHAECIFLLKLHKTLSPDLCLGVRFLHKFGKGFTFQTLVSFNTRKLIFFNLQTNLRSNHARVTQFLGGRFNKTPQTVNQVCLQWNSDVW